MKKTLLSIGVALLFGFGAMAQGTFKFTNQYQSAGEMQYKSASHVAGLTYAVGDAFKVTLTATSQEAITELLAIIVDAGDWNVNQGKTCGKDWWGEITGMLAFPGGAIAAGETFTRSVTLIVPATGCITPVNANLAFTAKNAAFPAPGNAPGTTDGSVETKTFNFTNASVTVVKVATPPGTLMPQNPDGKNQVDKIEGKIPTPFAIGDKFDVTVTGKASANASDFQIVAVDARPESGNWAELSDYVNLEGTVTAGTAFTLTGEMVITAVPNAFAGLATSVALMASSDVDILGIENLVITITKQGTGVNKTALNAAIADANTVLAANANKTDAVKADFTAAIAAAQAVANNASATQPQVDGAVTALATAKAAFLAGATVGIGDVVADKGEVVGYFTVTGVKLNEAPAKGVYFVKYSNGAVEKRVK